MRTRNKVTQKKTTIGLYELEGKPLAYLQGMIEEAVADHGAEATMSVWGDEFHVVTERDQTDEEYAASLRWSIEYEEQEIAGKQTSVNENKLALEKLNTGGKS